VTTLHGRFGSGRKQAIRATLARSGTTRIGQVKSSSPTGAASPSSLRRSSERGSSPPRNCVASPSCLAGWPGVIGSDSSTTSASDSQRRSEGCDDRRQKLRDSSLSILREAKRVAVDHRRRPGSAPPRIQDAILLWVHRSDVSIRSASRSACTRRIRMNRSPSS